MASPRNHNEPWTQADIDRIGVLARAGTTTKAIAVELGRTEEAVYSKASEEGISLLPPG